MRGTHLLHLLLIGLLAAAAAALNLHAPTVFFDSQMMVGGSLGVFALLEFGWPGLVVGLAALAVTVVRWGHPIELLVGLGLKETVTSLVNTAIGFLLFTALPAVRGGSGFDAARRREFAVGLALAATIISSMPLVFILSGQVTRPTAATV